MSNFQKKSFQILSENQNGNFQITGKQGDILIQGNNTFTKIDQNGNTDFFINFNGGGYWKGHTITLGEDAFGKTEFPSGGGGQINFYNGSNISHQIQRGANNQSVGFFRQGLGTNKTFVVGGSAGIETERISLQGQTLVKGANTLSTSSALQIYDGDGTPNLLWDFKNNGDVGINQTSNFLLDNQKTFKIDGSNNINTAKVFEINCGIQTQFGQGSITVGTYGNMEIKGTDPTGNFKVMTILGNDYFKLDGNGNNTLLRTKAFDIGTTTTTGYKISTDAGDHKFIRNNIIGAHFKLVTSDVLFWPAGIHNRTFVVGGALPIGTEEISLQGDTLLNANVNMPNLPTSASGLSSGDVYNDSGTLKIV